MIYTITFNPAIDSAFTNGIEISRPVTINGNGYTIDAKGQARILYVQADNVNIKDLTPYKDCFVPLQQGWNLRLSSDKIALSFDSPF